MNKEILLVVEAVSNEKGVPDDVIFGAVEAALEMATKRRAGEEMDIRVSINRKTGDYDTFRRWRIIPDPEAQQVLSLDAGTEEEGEENPDAEDGGLTRLILSEAKKHKPDAAVGGYIEEPMASVEFGRIAAQKARQVIIQKVMEAERAQMASVWRDRIGTLVGGVVRKVTREFVILDLGNGAEALLMRSEMIPHEAVRVNDRLRALLFEISPDPRGPQLLVSRTRPEMLIELFRVEVPEISEELIEIRAAARDPGSRAKIAVKTNDGRIDPVGACVGMRGARVQAVSGELAGERVDIILWSDSPAQLVINALSPAEVASIVVDEDTHTMDVAVREDQLSQAIGRNGQNVRLATELTDWRINVMTEAEAAARSAAENQTVQQLFCEKLGVDEEVAGILAAEGFTSLEEIAYVPREELLDVDGFDEELVNALRERAKAALLTKAIAEEQVLEKTEPAEDLLGLEGMERHFAYVLASHGVLTREDLAEQSVDDLLEIGGIDSEAAARLIMTARKPWFDETC